MFKKTLAKIKYHYYQMRFKITKHRLDFERKYIIPRCLRWISTRVAMLPSLHTYTDNGQNKQSIIVPRDPVIRLYEFLEDNKPPSVDVFVDRDGAYIHEFLKNYGYGFSNDRTQALLALLLKQNPTSIGELIDVLLHAHEQGLVKPLSTYDIIIALIRLDNSNMSEYKRSNITIKTTLH